MADADTGHPAYLTHLLPAQLIGGAGVGLTIPSLIGAGSTSLAAERFGAGSGILNMGRQVGTGQVFECTPDGSVYNPLGPSTADSCAR